MIELDDDTAREVRALAARLLRLVPDPDAPIHARDVQAGPYTALCRAPSERPRLTDDPDSVTCKRCRGASDYDAWAFRRRDPGS